jgi:chromosome segregation ATPase
MSSDTTRWPLLQERAPFATAAPGRSRRSLPRSAWLLMGLAFLCGGLISAAAFSIGWRHQAQRDTAARSALAAATARVHRLERRSAELRASLASARSTAAHAEASQRALVRAAANVGDAATASGRNATSLSSGAGSLTASARRIASELKTFDTYLTTTPAGQLDPGYIASQTAYLSHQLTRLEGDAGTLGGSVASFEAALRQLSSDAAALTTH